MEASQVTDGPFAETKEALGGDYLVEAADLDQAIAISKACPARFGGVEAAAVADAHRREWAWDVARRALPRLVQDDVEFEPGLPDDDFPGERLRLVVTCCHPALALEAQVALTLRLICGLSTAEVARAFLVSEPTMAEAAAEYRLALEQTTGKPEQALLARRLAQCEPAAG